MFMQDRTIAGLKKKNQELEKLRFVLDFQKNELEKQVEPQRDDISEKKERIHLVCRGVGAAFISKPQQPTTIDISSFSKVDLVCITDEKS